MEVIMRRARRTDAAAINHIFNQAVEDGDSSLDIDAKDQAYREQWLAAHDRRHPVYVGEVEGRVVCWVALSPYSSQYPFDGVAELGVYVDRDFRHQGLGGLLLKFIEQQAIALGYCKIILSVYATNLQALHAYRRAGYRDVGAFRNHGYHKGKLYDIIYMERLLPVDMEALNRYYRQNYPFYEEYFRREEALYEAQMLRNGMIRSEEDPTKWIPGAGHAGYVDDWNGQTVRVVKNAPPLEEIIHAQEESQREMPEAEPPEEAPSEEGPPETGGPDTGFPEPELPEDASAGKGPVPPAAEEAPKAPAAPGAMAEREPVADACPQPPAQGEAAETAPDQPLAEEPPAPAPTRPKGKKKKRKKAVPEEEDDPLEGQILLDEVIGRQE